MKTVDDPKMTDVQMQLMMHDWLAKYAFFDMQSLVDQVSSSSGGSDPITMTAFGTLLADQLDLAGVGDNGGVCLGYAATYALLVQHAFLNNSMEYNDFEDFIDNPVVDMAQIKYMTNVEDSSVASGDSGFGDGESMFNSPHFFNAVKVDQVRENTWYYVDAAYDDVSVEVISQYRVETDGNISHSNFLLAPSTMEEMYDGNYQFIDSLYDGVIWERVPYTVNGSPVDENGNFYGWMMEDADGTLYNPKQQANTDNQLFYVYECYENGERTALGVPVNEPRYEDDTFETAWFSTVNSEIIYDTKSDMFYYVEGTMNSYASMKDLMGDDENGSMFEDMNMQEMRGYANDPGYADELRVRPVGTTDIPVEDNNNNNGFGGMASQSEDEYSMAIFHYGFGSFGQAAEEDSQMAEENNSNNMMGGGNDYDEDDYGPFKALLDEDAEYRKLYPELNHSLALHNDVLYFNLGTKIFSYDLFKGAVELDGDELFCWAEGDENDVIAQVKEYTDVTYGSDGRRFTGMSFWTDAGDDYSLRYHPIAALCLKSEIVWSSEPVKDENGDPILDEEGNPVQTVTVRGSTPTLYVSIGTNFSNSYKGESGVAYAEEAVNYNAEYYRFMDDNKRDKENTNTEFMWCANVVDKMNMAGMVGEIGKYNTEVTVDPYCEKPGYTEMRSATYGLSDGTDKTEIEPEDEAVIYHDYDVHPIDKTLVCTKCLKPHDATIEQTGGGDDEANYIDTHKHTEGEPEFVWSQEEYEDEDGLTAYRDVCVAYMPCEEEYCDRNITEYECEITTDPSGKTIATVEIDGETYTDDRCIPGDVNGDGKVGSADLLRLRKYLVNSETEIDKLASDANGDGKVGSADLLRLRKYLVDPENVVLG